jgi:hypothetical protein
MTTTPPTTPTEVSDLLCTLQERFGWESDASRFEATAHWQRRSGAIFYRMLGSPGGLDVVVKVGTGWEPGHAERMFRSMGELEELIAAARIDRGHAIRPIGWADDPPSIVMPYVEGSDLVSILRDPTHQAWEADRRILRTWMVSAGAMLAAYHGAGDPCSHEEIEAAGADLVDLARRMLVRRSSITRVLAAADWRHRCAGLFGDFGPGNLLGAPDGDLYLLDPPDRRISALIHRDIANFIFEMRRQLAGRGFTSSRPVRRAFPELRSLFISGYAGASARGVLNQDDEALIALFELRRAGGMARKRWPGRPRDSAWFAGSALVRRLELARLTARPAGR